MKITGLDIMFLISAAVAIVSAVKVVTHRQVIYCALYLVLLVLATASIVLMLGGQFLAAVLILVYAGAIIVVYIFVIMLAGSGVVGSDVSRLRLVPAVIAAMLFAGALIMLPYLTGPRLQAASDLSNVVELGKLVLIDYVVVLELAGAVLLAAVIGAIGLAHRPTETQSRKEQSP